LRRSARRATTITMPHLGVSVSEGTIARWVKNEGDTVKRDESLVEIITDKVTAELPSPVSGRLVKILVKEDETVKVGAEIAQIEESSGTSSSGASSSAATSASSAPTAATATSSGATTATTSTGHGSHAPHGATATQEKVP